MTVTVANRKA